MLEGRGTLATARNNSIYRVNEAFINRSNRAGGSREVVYNMRISAGSARVVCNIRMNSA